MSPIAQSGSAWISWRSVGPTEDVEDPQTLLLIMGLSASSQMWWRLLPHVSRRHRAVVFDNRGTGDSDRVRGPLSMAGMAGDAVAVLDAAGVEAAHVMGASMGGMIAQHLALDHRDRVQSLILACTTAGGSAGAPNWRLMTAAALRPLLGAQRTFPLVAPALYSPTTMRERPERMREDLRRRAADDTPAATTYAQMAAIRGHDTRRRLGELAGLPTLVIHGQDDALVPPDRGRELAGLIPGAELRLIANCGHILATDAEDEVVGAVLGHLDGFASGPATLPAVRTGSNRS